MTELSPAAKAVVDAYWATPNEPITTKGRLPRVAAALLAAADQIENLYCDCDMEDSPGIVFALRQLMIIAAELKPSSHLPECNVPTAH